MDMTLSNDQRGFGVIEILLVVAVVAALSFVGYRVYQARTTQPVAQSDQQSTSSNPTPSAKQTQANQLAIKEWGIKIKMQDSSKLSYSLSTETRDGADVLQGNPPYEVLTPTIKSEFVSSKGCEDIGFSLYRTKQKLTSSDGLNRLVGGYYYFVTGSGGTCHESDNHPDDILRARIIKDFEVTSISAQ